MSRTIGAIGVTVAVPLVLAIGGCASSGTHSVGGRVRYPLQTVAVDRHMYAIGIGTVRATFRDGRLCAVMVPRVVNHHLSLRSQMTAVRWPVGYTIQLSPVRILDPQGNLASSHGGDVVFGGGYSGETTQPGDPCGAGLNIFIADDVDSTTPSLH